MSVSHAVPSVTTPQGVRFCLDSGDAKVPCAITRAALIFLAGHFLLERDFGTIFSAYQNQIEDAAARKYAANYAAKRDRRSPVTVHALDLATYAPGLAGPPAARRG
jgi:Protein of unknown function (DUF1488)